MSCKRCLPLFKNSEDLSPRHILRLSRALFFSFFFNSYPQKTYTVWFFHLPSVWFLLLSPPSCHLLLQCLWCCSSRCSAACADSCKMEFTRLMIYERRAMAPQRSDSCTFLLTAVCTQSCMQASGRERNFPDGSLQQQEYSWKNSVNHE